jgi:hypothetical protein
MTPEILLIAPVLFLITIVLALLLFSEGPGSNITAAARVRVDDTRRRNARSVQREEEEALKAREQDRHFLLFFLLTIFAILFTYLIQVK